MDNVRPYPTCTFTPRRSRWREWRQRLAFWIGALLVGLVALAFAWLADAAFASFKRLLEWAPWSPLLITPLGFAALAYLTQRWFENAKGSGIPKSSPPWKCPLAGCAPDYSRSLWLQHA